MRYLTYLTSDEHNDVVNNGYRVQEASTVVVRLLQAVVAHKDDDQEEDSDGYWHP